jgi:ABC-type transporter Mla MlaB component
MASKDDRPGLLSKVAMFVRNPTKDWSELDQPADSEASGYDKQALKAMIERKRQNDFVRKREFDQLRKLRNRDPGTLASMARPSFFQTSLPTDMDGRAGTIKKIDEIEAQMSRQWWKGKTEGVSQPATAPLRGESTQLPTDLPSSVPSQSDAGNSRYFATTLPYDMKQAGQSDHPDEFLPTQMASDMAPVRGVVETVRQEVRVDSTGFSTSRLFAIEVDEMATDPELEEAAIRFANSDDSGAEGVLLAALRGKDLALHAAQSWAAALLDFYRATKQRASFESAVQEFALHLDGARPAWLALGAPDPVNQAPSAVNPASCMWECPATLTAQDMESLRAAMVSQPMPWHLGWNNLEQIAPDAVGLLDALFGSLCDEAVDLRFDGADSLVQALRAITPSGERNTSTVCWAMRLNALRAMRMQDDFELAALDYCVTFEVSPPAWAEARCNMTLADTASDLAAQTDSVDTDTALPEDALNLDLQGDITGDATQVLSALESASSTAKCVFIHCNHLVRVDFAAAGSILNWVAVRQAEGKQVQFQNVHRLVAAFFNVIGINEHAKVIPRPI